MTASAEIDIKPTPEERVYAILKEEAELEDELLMPTQPTDSENEDVDVADSGSAEGIYEVVS